MIQSFTGSIQTNGEFKSVETLTGITFSSDNTYIMQIQNTAYLKIANAIFNISNEQPFLFNPGSEDLKIKTCSGNCILTILENENSDVSVLDVLE